MAVLQEFKCPNCDGAIEFDSSSQKLKCPYCEAEFEVDTLQALAEEQDAPLKENMSWDDLPSSQWAEGETEGFRVYSCNSCGGEIVAEETVGAAECPFCSNPVVMTGQFAGALKPDLVIPFKVDKRAAIAALQEHYKGKVLLPRVFKDQNHIQEVKGLYVPVWLFDTDVDAQVNFKATKVFCWSDSQYRYTETSHFSVVRTGNIGFENVPVDGSTKMDDTLMESIEPYFIEDAVDFQTAYLSGYLADKYDVDADSSVIRANQRIKQSTEEAFSSKVVGYDSVETVSSILELQNGRSRYALYPVWILNTHWNGQTFTFAVNGQTGKIAGDLPMDKGKFRTWLFGAAGVAAAVSFALSYLLWML